MISDNIKESPNQYTEEVSNKYLKFYIQAPVVKKILVPSFFSLLGDISNKSVIDFGCGTGNYTRLIKQKTSQKVIGVDISSEMIKIALIPEAKEPLGIIYEVHDIVKPYKNELFDIVVINYVLNHANSFEMLKAIIKNSFDILNKNGKVLGHTVSPFIESKNFPKLLKYGLKFEVDREPIQKYDPFHVEFISFDSNAKFDDFFVPPEDYERAFEECGFVKFKWFYPNLGEEFVNEKEEWEEYLEIKHGIMFEAFKP